MARAGNIIGGKYQLVARIGEGSMGSVWMANHLELGRAFAVKLLKDFESGMAHLEDRFLAEARLAASVRHRYVVDVLDVGRTDEGTPYLVMEYLPGISLAERLRRAPALSVRALLRLMRQALAGLDAVHRAGVLHRDLKPENIMLCPEGDDTIAKLVDFGISRALRATGQIDRDGNRLTAPGTTLGTPWYMAPEQAQALPEVDERSDIYAAGVILYEGLAGQLPFDHPDPQRALFMAVEGGAAPLSSLRPDLPAALSDVVAQAMSIDREERFANALALVEAIEFVSAGIDPAIACGTRGAVATSAASAQPAVESQGSHAPAVTLRAPSQSSPATKLNVVAPSTVTGIRRRRYRQALAVTGLVAVGVLAGLSSFRRAAVPPADAAGGPLSRAAESDMHPVVGRDLHSRPVIAPDPQVMGGGASVLNSSIGLRPASASVVSPATHGPAKAAKVTRASQAKEKAPDLFRSPGF